MALFLLIADGEALFSHGGVQQKSVEPFIGRSRGQIPKAPEPSVARLYGANLAVLSGWEGWHTFINYSDTNQPW